MSVLGTSSSMLFIKWHAGVFIDFTVFRVYNSYWGGIYLPRS